MIETGEAQERVILVAVSCGDNGGTEQSLDELEDLAATAGAVSVARIIQNREAVHSGTYVGKGKIEEIKAAIYEYDATGIVCDDELSPAQLANLEEALEVKVLDRTLVILDIFAAHASTSEGKIQVELAQLRYRATRLVGLRKSLSRLGGGIGTKGPGETKLEMDRRVIHERIGQLKSELDKVVMHRELTRGQRKKTGIPVAAIVGYTNAGKSTLLNALTGAGVLEEDKLFATLDPTVRSLELEGGQQLLVSDTVGFIGKLPHHLVEAFKSTLEEAVYADIIIHVADSSNPAMDMQMHTVYETLSSLGVGDKPVITVFNKLDKTERDISVRDFKADYTVRISAKTGEGVEELKSIIGKVLRESRVYLDRLFGYDEAGKIALVRKYGQLLSEEYVPEGIAVKAYVP
ncbi:MAG: GTPase HflX, partial [Butyrivibrio sp.]|nr:GTPase HflX [Butyrivibrio sp.]